MPSAYTTGQIARRPVLEIIKQPLYDYVGVASLVPSQQWFSNPLGSADANAANALSKTFSDTNMRRSGSLPTPQQFDIFAMSVKYSPNCTTVPASISVPDRMAFLGHGNLNLEVGQKSYLRLKLDSFPEDVAMMVQSLAVAADHAVQGWPITTNVLDVSIPEELYDPAQDRTYLTGRRVPIHLPSEQSWGVTIEFPGQGANTFTLSATRRVGVMLHGLLRREVQ